MVCEGDPPRITARSGRSFATYPVALVVFLVDAADRLLALSAPARPGWWEVVNGAMEAGETVLDAALRETAEEAGPDVRVRPLGAFHAETFSYDQQVRHMISICYLMSYQGGKIRPGSDMAGSEVQWFGLPDLDARRDRLIPPLNRLWIPRRALELHHRWKADEVDLQQSMDRVHPTKYELPGRPDGGTRIT